MDTFAMQKDKQGNPKTYIYGDVHNHIKDVQHFLEKYKPEKVIWLGDWFDSYTDNGEIAGQTAAFLQSLIHERPQDIFILGNHDISYMIPQNNNFKGYGWTAEKQDAVSEFIGDKEWGKFQIVYFDNLESEYPIIFSHAGYTDKDCLYTNTPTNILQKCANALNAAHRKNVNWTIDSLDGPLWCRDCEVHNSYYQVFGHTPIAQPVVTPGFRTANINFDCARNYFGFFNKTGVYQIDRNTGKNQIVCKFE